jgi:hypothetical protein
MRLLIVAGAVVAYILWIQRQERERFIAHLAKWRAFPGWRDGLIRAEHHI